MDDQTKRNGENKGGSAVWFAVIIASSLGIVGLLLFNQPSKTLTFPEFQSLLKVTRFSDTDRGTLITNEDELSGRLVIPCLLYTSPSPRDQRGSRMPSSA